MRRQRLLALSALALTIFAVSTTTASAALPSLLLLAGTTGLTINASSTVSHSLWHGIVAFLSIGFHFIHHSKGEMTSLGTTTLAFTNLVFGAKRCKANGETAG